MKDTITSSFLDKLIDWKDFEFFVADIYSDFDQVKVEHNVTELGKSNAPRQIDVKVTQTNKLHTIITLIECKRWKKRVTRQVIDVMFASVEDLSANKGVIFTTVGYESGAIEYAKSKNIDIFIVRDIRDSEFGQPGRQFSLFLQMFNGEMKNFKVPAKFLQIQGLPPKGPAPSFQMTFSENQQYSKEHQLISIHEEDGPNLVKLLIDIRADLLKRTCDLYHQLLKPEDDKLEVADSIEVTVNFSDYKFKYLKYDTGLLMLDILQFDFVRSISQSKMTFDRLASVDFGLIVENYITNQRNYVSKMRKDDRIFLSRPIVDDKTNDSEAVKDRSIIKVTLDHFVGLGLKKETKIKKSEPLTINLESK